MRTADAIFDLFRCTKFDSQLFHIEPLASQWKVHKSVENEYKPFKKGFL